MVDRVVLEAFKSFDQDGSGSISREELSGLLGRSVLKAIGKLPQEAFSFRFRPQVHRSR